MSAAEQAAIRRATLAAQRAMDKLDAAALKELEEIYRVAAAEIKARIADYAGYDGNLALTELQNTLVQVQGRLRDLGHARDALLNGKMPDAADLGLLPFAPALGGSASLAIANDALQFVRTFVAEDGLQLSDRIWRLDYHAREAVTNAIEQAVIQGHGAAQAAREFLARGVAVPSDVANKINAANVSDIGGAALQALTGTGSPLDNAMRLFRTELNRAHGEAYIKGALEHPDAAGVRFLLSPAHPKPDICDLLSSANLYGLGPGVYPNREKCPWPAHPNTLSYVEVVFKDEITAADRAGKETPLQALERLTPAQRLGVLGKNKAAAFKDGKLTAGMIKAPWRSVKKRVGFVAEAAAKSLPARLALDDFIAAGKPIAEKLLAQARTRTGYHVNTFIENLHKELNAVRPTGTAAQVQSRGKGAKLVQAASLMFPDDWTKAADRFGPLYARASNGRGYHLTLPKDAAGQRARVVGFGKVDLNGGDGFVTVRDFKNSVHEYAHRLQSTIPELDSHFQAIHGRRTAGDPLRKLRDVLPYNGYRSNEVTREDSYYHAYQGRIYSGYGHSYLGEHGALEVMTMAFQAALSGDHDNFHDIVGKDPEMLNLVIGLLFKYVP